MRTSRFSAEQIVRIVGEHEAGKSADDVCRQHGISRATLYRRKQRTPASNGWWLTKPSTTRCCRSCWENAPDADGPARSGAPAAVSGFRASRRPPHR